MYDPINLILTTISLVIKTKCPTPKCSPGFKYKEVVNKPVKMSAMFQTQGIKTPLKKSYTKGGYRKTKQMDIFQSTKLPTPSKKGGSDYTENEGCMEFICIPEQAPPGIDRKDKPCPEPECPKDYEIILEQVPTKSNECAKYSCEPPPQNDAICNVTGRTFTTFDGTEFKFDICSHLLARDLSNDKWSVTCKFY